MATTPPINEQFLREVDDELRRDQALSLWKRWGRWAVGGLVLALAAFAGFLAWQNYQDGAAGAEGEKLTQALDKLGAGKTDGVKPDLETLTASRNEGVRAAAKLTLAALSVQNSDLKAAATQYGAIAADTSLARPYRDLALVRQTAAEFDSMKPEAVVARLQPLAVAGNPWFGSAGEMVALAYIRMNKPQQAAPLIAAIAKDETVPQSIRSRIADIAQIMGTDTPVPTSPAATAGDKN